MKLSLLVLGFPLLLCAIVFARFLPAAAKGPVISGLFGRLLDWLMGPVAKEYIITSKRRRGFLEF